MSRIEFMFLFDPDGGYGEDELIRGGAAGAYQDPADLPTHPDEVGGRR
jgi:hypothetical protein